MGRVRNAFKEMNKTRLTCRIFGHKEKNLRHINKISKDVQFWVMCESCDKGLCGINEEDTIKGNLPILSDCKYLIIDEEGTLWQLVDKYSGQLRRLNFRERIKFLFKNYSLFLPFRSGFQDNKGDK